MSGWHRPICFAANRLGLLCDCFLFQSQGAILAGQACYFRRTGRHGHQWLQLRIFSCRSGYALPFQTFLTREWSCLPGQPKPPAGRPACCLLQPLPDHQRHDRRAGTVTMYADRLGDQAEQTAGDHRNQARFPRWPARRASLYSRPCATGQTLRREPSSRRPAALRFPVGRWHVSTGLRPHLRQCHSR